MRLETESDSSDVIEACTSQEENRGEATDIYRECKFKIRIGKVKFAHCNRSDNEVAHSIARFMNSCNWVDEPLAFC